MSAALAFIMALGAEPSDIVVRSATGVVRSIQGASIGDGNLWWGTVGEFTYTVDVNIHGLGTLPVPGLVNTGAPIPYAPPGSLVCCHQPGTVVFGAMVNETLLMDFREFPSGEDC